MSRDVRVASGAWTTAILLCGAVLASRSGEAAAGTESSLAGTEWRLVEIQSMDDAIGTVRPDDPSRYTMRLNADGTAKLRLDCNRASGTWSAEASADRSSGRFEFGPLAATRALCPPPRLDERVVKDAGFIRSYLLKDGRLYLSLKADGGIYAWEPLAEEPFLTQPDPGLEAAILRASPAYTRAVVDAAGGTGQGRYVYGRVDLNGDGWDEVLVYLLGSIFCGTGGCDLLLFTQGQDGYSLVNELPISRLPVIVSADKTGTPSTASSTSRRSAGPRTRHRRAGVTSRGSSASRRGSCWSRADLSAVKPGCDQRLRRSSEGLSPPPRSTRPATPAR